MDTHDLFGARLETVIVKLLRFDTFALGLIDCLRRCETLLFELDLLSLKSLHLFNLLFHLSSLLWVQPGHVDVRVFTHNSLLVLKSTLLENFASRLLKHVVNPILDNLVDLVLAGKVFG